MSKLTQSSSGKTCIRCGGSDAYENFLSRRDKCVVVDKDTGCHLWVGAKDGGGYGYLTVRYEGGLKKNYKIHRLVYEFEAREPVDGFVVMHICDNPACCNVNHLKRGTLSDNTRDMVKKRRHPKHMKACSDNKNRRLNNSQVKEILTSKLSSRKIAPKFGISYMTILQIRKNKGYTNERHT